MPTLVRVAEKLCWFPVGRLPKLRLVGLTLSWPEAMPEPDNETACGLFEALLVIVIDPVTLPTPVGANTTLKVELWPAVMVTGIVGWLKVNCGAESVTLETVISTLPLLVAVTVKVLLLATGTPLKSRTRVFNPRLPGESFPCGGGVVVDFPPALKP